MGRITKYKNKQARREGVDLGLKTFGTKSQARLLKRLNIIPGFKQTKKFNSKLSDYGRQLREKQKLKRIYGLSEKQLARYFKKAVHEKGNSAENLIQLLETRLDNIIYRLHFAPTRSASRQLVVHGHFKLNDKKNDIPSHKLKINDKLTFLNTKSTQIPYIKEILEEKNYLLPIWLKRDQIEGQVVALPKIEDYKEPVDLALVIEFYSKL